MSLHGAHVALATPVDEAGSLDHGGLGRLLDHIVGGGVSVVCTTGSTGEGPRLSAAGRREVLVAVRERADVRLVPAPSGGPPAEVLEELREFADLGATAALVPVPSYFPMNQTEVATYYATLADASPLPLLIYNIPPMTGVSVMPSVVGDLATHPRVVGVKDSSRDLEYFQQVVSATAEADDFAVLTGSDTMLLASMVVGGHGAIAASANLVPRLPARIVAAVADENWPQARRLQRRLFEIVTACRAGSPPAGWKAALEHAGICSRRLVPPGSGLDDDGYATLAARLDALGVDQPG